MTIDRHRTFIVLPLLLAAGLARADPPGTPTIGQHTSRLGLSFELAPDWHRLDPALVPQDPAELAADPRFAGVDPRTFLAAVRRVESGHYDFYFRAPEHGFAENMAISRRSLTLPSDGSEVQSRCESLPAMLSKRYGRGVAPARCGVRSVDGRVANYVEVEGPIPGTWNLQCQIQASHGVAVSILATVWSSNLESMRSEFDALLESLHFDGISSP